MTHPVQTVVLDHIEPLTGNCGWPGVSDEGPPSRATINSPPVTAVGRPDYRCSISAMPVASRGTALQFRGRHEARHGLHQLVGLDRL